MKSSSHNIRNPFLPHKKWIGSFKWNSQATAVLDSLESQLPLLELQTVSGRWLEEAMPMSEVQEQQTSKNEYWTACSKACFLNKVMCKTL